MNKLIDDSTLQEDNAFTDDNGFSETPYMKEGEVTPLHLLGFAKIILLMVAIIYILAAISELFIRGNAVYEACKITLPSIATLVIGYYFGSTKN